MYELLIGITIVIIIHLIYFVMFLKDEAKNI